jgi:rare lipoprotein A (peptidoglycan hydrolase)
LAAEENGTEISRELLAVNNGYGSSNEQEELAAQPGASGKNIRMAIFRSSASRRMLDAAACSPPLGSAAEHSASGIADRVRSSDARFVVRTGFQCQRTSGGEIFRENRLTAASRILPMGSQMRVTNLNNGRSVVVRINDRGPYVHGRGIDLSEGAAREIGLTRKGVARVRLTSFDEPRQTIRSEHSSWRRVRVRRRTHHQARSRAPYGS